jgi:hypothetical protein
VPGGRANRVVESIGSSFGAESGFVDPLSAFAALDQERCPIGDNRPEVIRCVHPRRDSTRQGLAYGSCRISVKRYAVVDVCPNPAPAMDLRPAADHLSGGGVVMVAAGVIPRSRCRSRGSEVIQQGQVFKLKAKSADGEPLWAYEYRVAGRGVGETAVGRVQQQG